MKMLLTWIGDERVLTELIATIPSYALLIIMAICIFVLWRCADIMIEGSVNLALRTGLPKIVIGATIISLGTTFPEMFVSVVAAWMGNPGLVAVRSQILRTYWKLCQMRSMGIVLTTMILM